LAARQLPCAAASARHPFTPLVAVALSTVATVWSLAAFEDGLAGVVDIPRCYDCDRALEIMNVSGAENAQRH
jgi:hypothetical protein